jgi:hypothetical protein
MNRCAHPTVHTTQLPDPMDLIRSAGSNRQMSSLLLGGTARSDLLNETALIALMERAVLPGNGKTRGARSQTTTSPPRSSEETATVRARSANNCAVGSCRPSDHQYERMLVGRAAFSASGSRGIRTPRIFSAYFGTGNARCPQCSSSLTRNDPESDDRTLALRACGGTLHTTPEIGPLLVSSLSPLTASG